ncbi:MAG TPA: hypothetical protein VG294_13100 [Solirubrobacteraceae bacterium]|nr:hypothetical protein [Solirubrobacteraceae bacterium]
MQNAVGMHFPGQHYALLVSDEVFDQAIERIKADGIVFILETGLSGNTSAQPGPTFTYSRLELAGANG